MKLRSIQTLWVFALVVGLSGSAVAQRQLERLGRGMVAVRTGTSSAYVGWRLLGNDAETVGFNLYRVTGGVTNKLNAALLTNTTDYVDSSVNFAVANSWFVEPVVGGVAQAVGAAATLAAGAPTQQYLNIPLMLPAGGTAYDGVPYTCNANDCSVGDVDGDGEYEIIVKWDPSNSQDNSFDGFTGNTYLDCYKLNGTRLWRIDLGPNIRSGAHYMDFMVYDFDGDGKAELMCRTAPGALDGLGNYVGGTNKWQTANGPRPVFNNTNDYRFNNPNGTANGYVLAGPEFLSVFNGLTGEELATSTFYPKRDPDNNDDNPSASRINAVWGDGYGNRLDRFLAGLAFCDGRRPSGIFCRGYYTRAYVSAWDWRGGTLSLRWTFSSDDGTPGNSAYRGQGAHSLSIGDVDGDGKDEIIYGAASIDDNGKGLYSTGLGHGDALHVSDMNPWRPGKEVWMVHESPGSYGPNGLECRDAKTGALIFGVDGQGADVGRGCAYDIDPRYPGYEMWGARGGLMSSIGTQISSSRPSQMNFCAWWDADVLRETIDGTTVYKWNWTSSANTSILSPAGIASNNSTKSTPNLSADILGDWREEIIWRTSDNLNLRIYTTTTPATNRIYTLMQDPQYRCAIAWQNTGYNQPPHPGYFLGANMYQPPLAQLSDAQLVWRGNAANVWDENTTANWLTNNTWSSNTPASTFVSGASVLFDLSGSNASPVTIAAPLAPGDVTVYSYKDYTFTGAPLTGGMTLKKAGSAALTLAATNTFTGATAVSDGALLVDGLLTASPVTARWPGVVGGRGIIGGGLTLTRGSAIAPGLGSSAGTLTISNSLRQLGEVENQFDLSSDPAGITGTNDFVQVFGNVTATGTNVIEVNKLNAAIGYGIYPLIGYSGTFSGGASNFTVTGLEGELYYVTNQPGLLALALPAHRAATNITWAGSASAWDLGATANWTDGSGAQTFLPDDNVRFDNTGTAFPTVSLVSTLRPGGITVDSTANYTLGGSGYLVGPGGLNKTNSGTLTISSAAHQHTGRTIIGGGVLSIAAVANGGVASPLGASVSAASNLVFHGGGTLRFTGATASTDRGATLNAGGGGVIEVTSSTATLTMSGTFTGGGSLTKLGAGILNLSGANNYSGGTVGGGGSLSLGAAVANTSGLGSGSLTLSNGTTLDMFASDSGDTSAGGPFVNPLIVPSNTTGTIWLPFRINISSALSGGGTLNVRCNGSRNEIFGNWSAFTGQINVTSRTGTSDFRCNNSAGYPLAKLNLAAGTTLQNRVGGTPTISVGELSGASTAMLIATGGSDGLGVTWRVGGLDTSATFAGVVTNNIGLLKIGTGAWTLAGTNYHTGATTVSNGTLFVTGDSSASPSVVTVNPTGTLGGTGRIGGVTVVSGTLAPGVNGLGAMGFSNNLTFTATGTAAFDIRKSPFGNDAVNVAGALTCNGTLAIANLGGTLAQGDSFPLFNAALISGTFTAYQFPPLAAGLSWDTNAIYTTGALTVIGTNAPVTNSTGGILWRGDAGSTWDVNATASWRNASDTAVTFIPNDAVTFDDTGSNANAVTLSGTLQPARVTVNAAKNYTFSGAGVLAGTNALVKSGTGTLTISSTNSYSGGTILSNGAVQLSGPAAGGYTANTFGLGAGAVTFRGGALQLYGYNLADNSAGFGPLTNDLVIPAGETGTLQTGARQTISSRVTGGGTLNLKVDYVRGDVGGDWTAFTGLLNVSNTTGTPPSSTSDDFRVATTSGFPAARLRLNSNVFLYSRATAGAVIPIGEFSASPGSGVSAGGGSGASAQNAVTWRVGGLNTDATNAAVFQGTTALTKEGTGAWVLTGASSNTGPTTVSNGILRVDGSFGVTTVNVWGGTLGGSGVLAGPVNINSGGAIAPGNGIGTLTVSNAVTLATGSFTRMEISKSPPVNDLLRTTGVLTFGGTLMVTNNGEIGLAAGDSFLLFSAGGYSGVFAAVNLPPLSGGLAWNTNSLAAAGIISVTNVPVLKMTGFSLKSGALIVNGSGGMPGGQYLLRAASDLALPIGQWEILATNAFDGAGDFNFTNLFGADLPARFYRLQLLP